MAQAAVDWVGRINAFAREKEKGKRKRLGLNRFTASRAPVPVVSPGASRRHRATERERERERERDFWPELGTTSNAAQTPHHKPSRQLVKTRSEPAPKRLDTEPEGGEWGRVEGGGGIDVASSSVGYLSPRTNSRPAASVHSRCRGTEHGGDCNPRESVQGLL